MSQPPSTARTGGRVNIAFTEAAEEAARRLVNRFPFAALVDTARVGAAFALREGMSLSRPEDFGPANGSNFNVGSVDPGGDLRDLLVALHPQIQEDPYRVLETLMSQGVLAIDERVASGEILSLRDLMGVEIST